MGKIGEKGMGGWGSSLAIRTTWRRGRKAGGPGVICAPEGGAGACDWMEGIKGP